MQYIVSLSIQEHDMSARVCTLLAVLLVTMQQIHSRPSQRAHSLSMLPYDQETGDSAYDTAADQSGSEDMGTLMYQMMQRAAQEQELHQLQLQLQHQEEREQGSNPTTPEEVPMLDESTVNADKRGSYMSLCHFKICNMGRKRTLRRPQQWGRF